MVTRNLGPNVMPILKARTDLNVSVICHSTSMEIPEPISVQDSPLARRSRGR